MTASIAGASNNKIGTCPHGLPLGACPICNGMGGGGSVKKDTKPREMTWDECYAIGQMLKAQKAARQQTLQAYATQDMQAYLSRLQEQMNAVKAMVMNSLPRPIAKAISALTNIVLAPAIKVVQAFANGIQNIANFAKTMFENVKQKFVDIADKLNAMFGEAKAAIQKKIDEKFKDLKKKVFNLFGLSTVDNEEDEKAKRIEETKNIFELNTTKEIEIVKKHKFSEEELSENIESDNE